MHVFLAGMPSCVGGACEESGHTALLWRKAGIEVECLTFARCRCGKPNVQPLESNPWTARMRDAGVSFVAGESGKLHEVPGLAGSIVVSFCNQHFLHNWPELHGLGCRCVWSPTMTFVMPREGEAFAAVPPTAVHFQSKYQSSELRHEYEIWGCKEFRIIPGAFEPLPFRPLPHTLGEPFVVGRLARTARTKWTPHLWNILQDVRDRGVDVRALCMGWTDKLTDHCGQPPPWATCLPLNSISSAEFLSRCHAMVCANFGVKENWPRVGLEAMSAGVPLLVDDAGGWQEMIEHQITGMLCGPQDFATHLHRLAIDEEYRQAIIQQARDGLPRLVDDAKIAGEWVGLFNELGTGPTAKESLATIG